MALNVNGGPLEFDAIIDGSQFQAMILSMERNLRSLTKTANEESAAIENVAKKAATAIGGYLTLTAAKNFIQDIVRVRGEFQQLEVAFSTMLRSKDRADKLLAQVAELAAKTPFGLQDAARGTKQLLAYGFQAEEIIGTLRTLGNVAAGVSAPLNDIVYLYGTLRTQGRAYNIDIRQFTSRGIPIIKELAKQFGVSADKVNDLVAAGKVGFPEIEKAFQSMTGQGGIFFNLMEEQSKTLTGQISNLEDAFQLMLNDFGKSTEGIAGTTIEVLTTLVEHYQDVINIIEVLIASYGAYKAAIIIVNTLERIRAVQLALQTAGVSSLTVAEYLHYQALVITEKAQKLLNATMLSNPYVAIATVLAGLTAALIIYGRTGVDVASKEQLLADANKKVTDSIDDQRAKMRPYLDILKSANTTEGERLAAYKKLAEINPKIVSGIDAKSVSQQKLTENVNAYVEALRNQIKLEANQAAVTSSLKREQELRDRIAEIQKQIQEEEKNLSDSGLFSRSGRARSAIKSYQFLIDENTKKLREQEQITNELGAAQVKAETTAVEAIKLTNAQLIAQAKSLDEIKAIRDDIEEAYKGSTIDKERAQLAKDLLAADKRAKELDPYGNIKKSAKEAQKESNKLKALLDQILALEAKATAVTDGKEDGSVAKVQNEIDKLIKRAEALNAGDGVILRIRRAGQIILDDATAKAAAKDIENKLNSELSKVNIALTTIQPDSQAELELRKQAITKQLELEINATKQQYTNDVTSQQALQDKIAEIKAKARKEALDLDKEYARRSVDEQLRAIKAQSDIKNIQDQRIVDDPLSTVNQRYTAQENILKRNKKALQEMLQVLQKFAASGLGNTKELNEEMSQLQQELAGVNSELNNTENAHLVQLLQELPKALSEAGNAFRSLASDLSGVNDSLADTLETMADLLTQVSNLAQVGSIVGKVSTGKFTGQEGGSAASSIGGLAGAGAAIGAIFGGIGSVVGAAVGAVVGAVAAVLKGGKKVRESLQKTYETIYAFQVAQELGEYRINELLRERNLIKAQEVELTLQALKAQKEALTVNQQQNQADQERILAALQGESFITGQTVEKYGGFLGLWKKSQAVNQYQSLLGMTFEQIEALYSKGQLDGRAKALFEELQKLQEEGQNIQAQLDSLEQQAREVFTGTTAESITDSIVQGFANGELAAQDFADNFEDLMRNAALNALKYQYLEAPLQDFYEQFANAAQSDNVLTSGEIADLQDKYNQIIEQAAQQFEQLQDITDLNLSAGSNEQNTLQGAIKGITEQQAELLAGQFGGLRMTAIQQLQIATQNLSVLNAIKTDTANLSSIDARLRKIETVGIKIIK